MNNENFCATNPISLPQLVLILGPLIVGLLTRHYFNSVLLGVISTALLGIFIYWFIYIRPAGKHIPPPDNYSHNLIHNKPNPSIGEKVKEEVKEEALVK